MGDEYILISGRSRLVHVLHRILYGSLFDAHCKTRPYVMDGARPTVSVTAKPN